MHRLKGKQDKRGGFMKIIKKACQIIRGIMTFIAVVVLITAAICVIFQYKPAIVISGSMEPTIGTGSFILIDKKDKDVDVGDIIAYKHQDMQVSHRIVEITEDGYITKGDANDNVDFYAVDPDNLIGTAKFTIPKIGYILDWTASAQGIILLTTICVMLLLTSALINNMENKK